MMTTGRWPVVLSGSVFLVGVGLYLTLVGSLGSAEISAGVIASAMIAAFVGLQHRGQRRRFQLRAPLGRVIGALLAALVVDTGRVAAVLLRAVFVSGARPAGSISRQPFDSGSEQAVDAGRRALVTVASSLAPNGFVLDVTPSLLDGSDGALLMHQLAPVRLKADTAWPV